MKELISLPSILNNSSSVNSLNKKVNPLKTQFLNALDLIKDRQLTFAKFAFKQAEIEDSRNIRPLLKEINDKQNNGGTFFVNELWDDKNMNYYVQAAQVGESKRAIIQIANKQDSKQRGKLGNRTNQTKRFPNINQQNQIKDDLSPQVWQLYFKQECDKLKSIYRDQSNSLKKSLLNRSEDLGEKKKINSILKKIEEQIKFNRNEYRNYKGIFQKANENILNLSLDRSIRKMKNK